MFGDQTAPRSCRMQVLPSCKLRWLVGQSLFSTGSIGGASGPRLLTFEDFEEFEAHLKDHALPGDAFDVWEFVAACKPEAILVEGKLHDDDGCVPRGGAY